MDRNKMLLSIIIIFYLEPKKGSVFFQYFFPLLHWQWKRSEKKDVYGIIPCLNVFLCALRIIRSSSFFGLVTLLLLRRIMYTEEQLQTVVHGKCNKNKQQRRQQWNREEKSITLSIDLPSIWCNCTISLVNASFWWIFFFRKEKLHVKNTPIRCNKRLEMQWVNMKKCCAKTKMYRDFRNSFLYLHDRNQ